MALAGFMGKIRRLDAENSLICSRLKGTGDRRVVQVEEACYISGKELVDHRTQVQTMYAPAGDVGTLGNAVGSYE